LSHARGLRSSSVVAQVHDKCSHNSSAQPEGAPEPAASAEAKERSPRKGADLQALRKCAASCTPLWSWPTWRRYPGTLVKVDPRSQFRWQGPHPVARNERI